MRRQPKSQKHSVDGEVPNVNLIELRGHGLDPRFREGEVKNNAAMSETLVS